MALHDHAIELSTRGMRILRFPLVRLLTALAIFGLGSALSAVLLDLVPQQARASSPLLNIYPAASVLLQVGFALLGYWLFTALFEGRPATELFSRVIRNSLLGIMLGVVFISLVMAVMAVSGAYRISGWTVRPEIWSIFWMAVFAGFIEEILLRGYFFRLTEELLGTWWSVALSALVFGFLHIWNPNASVISSLAIALTAGVVLALLYVITRNLWSVIGLHFAWNFTLGGVYSAPVSGGEASGLFQADFEGPVWLTGGSFGPEASVITVVVFLLFAVWLVTKVIRDKQVIQPIWKKQKSV